MDFQNQLYEKFAEFRIPRDDAPYPPYHDGKYLEEYFVDKFQNEKNIGDRYLIPVYWTSVFNHASKMGLHEGTKNYKLRQKLLSAIRELPTDKKYFTVSTHDDAPQGIFPNDTMHFYAGGNSSLGTDPIPLICSGFANIPDNQKLIFCSFVGSATNQIRNNALAMLSQKDGYLVSAFHWRPDVSEDQQTLFFDVTSRSRFTLCPRGYGATSYRLYEAMQLGSIPVYISDKHLLPWSDELDWSEFCVVVDSSSSYDALDNCLKNMTETQVRKMQDAIKENYPLYFTIPAVYNQITKRIK